ncbi:hypothetical protein [Bdellovibrio bacteriovorus]
MFGEETTIGAPLFDELDEAKPQQMAILPARVREDFVDKNDPDMVPNFY